MATRREAIVSSAARLFARQGYPATGIDEIGAAAGITGPGVYRHFDGKNDVLAEVVLRAVDGVVGRVGAVVGADDPWAVLEGLVDNLLDAVLDDRAAWTVVLREQRHLDGGARRALGRAHRVHVEAWVQALAAARPDLDDAAVRAVVQGVLGIVTPVGLRPGAPPGRARVRQLLRETALAVMRHAGRA